MKIYFCYLFAFVVLTFSFDQVINGQSLSDKSYCGKGYKEYHYGVPFLYLKGKNYDAGYQYGYLLKDELLKMYDEFHRFKNELLSREIKYLPGYQRVLANMFGSIAWKHKINKLARQLPVDIKEQQQGMSKASGLPIFFFNEIQVIVDLYSGRCEAIAILKDGKTYHCHNLDQPYPISDIGKYPAVTVYNIDGMQQYTNIGFVACLSLTTAFNENGISYSENGNNNHKPFDNSKSNLYIEKNKFLTQAHNMHEVDSLVDAIHLPVGLIVTIASSKENKAMMYDILGTTKGRTTVKTYQFAPNWTMNASLRKKNEWIYADAFHNTSRNIKFEALIDTTNPNMVDEAIGILSHSDFYHYSDSITVHLESLHNFETDQSVIFNLADSLVYFAVYPHFAAWSQWLKFNYITREVSLYKDVDSKLNRPDVVKNVELMKQLESCDWRDSSEVRKLVNSIIGSRIENYYTLDFLTITYLDKYKMPNQAMIYAEKFIKKYPDIATGYHNKGLIYKNLNQNKEAIGEFQKSLDCPLNCDYYKALTFEQLALTYTTIAHDEKAKENAIKALEIHNQYWIPEWLNQRIEKLNEISKKEKSQIEK